MQRAKLSGFAFFILNELPPASAVGSEQVLMNCLPLQREVANIGLMNCLPLQREVANK